MVLIHIYVMDFGAEIMRSEGYPLVMHWYVNVIQAQGCLFNYIESNHLPIPHRDMLPVSVEEQVICYADKFFQKHIWDNSVQSKRLG